jgi:DNA polymerase-3 subunit epsilon
MKTIFFDTETTGLDSITHDVIQFSGMIVECSKVLEEFDLRIQPRNRKAINQEALDTHGITLEQMYDFIPPTEAYNIIISMFDKYVDRYEPLDKLIPIGHNIKFDLDMMNQFFKKSNDDYFYSFVSGAGIDTLQLAVMYELKKRRRLFKSYKLTNLCKEMNIQLDNAHDALVDIRATRELAKVFWNELQ